MIIPAVAGSADKSQMKINHLGIATKASTKL